MGGGTALGKAICSICYEDLKPLVEDLQAISVCGHVFHELCLQQWFEYCLNAKKNSCPVCKQTCSANHVSRLYFQSIGDPDDTIPSQRPSDRQDDCEALRRESKRLESKISGLNSALERHQKNLKDLNEELCLFKEATRMEAALKNDALKQKASIQRMFHLKSEELEKSTVECLKLQERNMDLAKELAAIKLVSDLNLEEEDVLKLASFGNEGNNKDKVDVLKRSLVIRNKSYKELMAKCNHLGRGEARSLKKLEKAKEKINKLKIRVQELETAIEMKDNEVLRALRVSKKTTCEEVSLDGLNWTSSFLSKKHSSENRVEQPATPIINLDQVRNLSNDQFGSRETENFKPMKDVHVNDTEDDSRTISVDGEKDFCILIEEDVSKISRVLHELDSKPQVSEDVAVGKPRLSKLEASSHPHKEASVGASNLVGHAILSTGKTEMLNVPVAARKEDAMLLSVDVIQDQSLLHIKREAPSSVSLSVSGDRCFSGGLLGPDGTNRHLGKWCRRSQSKGATASSGAMQASSASTADLIAVGADGRGGKIKVLRSRSHSSMDVEGPVWTKRCKHGDKTSSLQSKGYLQIEHFFGKGSH
ncbi:uncharacterized protein LOC131166808 [Malania oleifera]|uniref:uncharacterized protein LOC131166808 n=1 Tax=Malania oleifera TaxID=397392 RepID=UPI0025AE0122|nr:uncharacterized protein LOC131166808 [Malania oleifera]XP_057981378.1 uncharacterized protein LOC131166808 [Malania oleifera]